MGVVVISHLRVIGNYWLNIQESRLGGLIAEMLQKDVKIGIKLNTNKQHSFKLKTSNSKNTEHVQHSLSIVSFIV